MLVAVAILLTGCIQTTRRADPALEASPPEIRSVLLMPPDVTLARLTTGGVEEVEPDWTAAARRNLADALQVALAARVVDLVAYAPADEEGARMPAEDLALVRLHRLVAAAVLQYKYGAARLPTKKGRFDWTLGGTARRLAGRFGAQYGLFIHVHDTYASWGRKIVATLAGGLGIYLPQGETIGFASLVDLRTGQLVWAQLLRSRFADLRRPEGAEEVAAALLRGFPTDRRGPPAEPAAEEAKP